MLPRADAFGPGPVLIVDDEETINRLLVHLLASAGLTAETVSNGTAALECLRADPQRYTCLLVDLHMPAPAGPEVLREARVLRPDLPVVVMSGQSEADAAGHLAGSGPIAFLQKPFRKDELFLALRQVLASGGPR